jgi:hypothetical protein
MADHLEVFSIDENQQPGERFLGQQREGGKRRNGEKGFSFGGDHIK